VTAISALKCKLIRFITATLSYTALDMIPVEKRPCNPEGRICGPSPDALPIFRSSISNRESPLSGRKIGSDLNPRLQIDPSA
jgi:hypothetical protein